MSTFRDQILVIRQSPEALLLKMIDAVELLGRLAADKDLLGIALRPRTLLAPHAGPIELDVADLLALQAPELLGHPGDDDAKTYIAPESLPDAPPGVRISEASTVYSLGMIALFCLSRQALPRTIPRAKHDPELHRTVLNTLLRERVSDGAMWRTLKMATDHDPSARQPTIIDFLSDLRIALGGRDKQPLFTTAPVRGGRFVMGASPRDLLAAPRERPTRIVRVSSFEMSRFPITNGILQHVTGREPQPPSADPDAPATHISFTEAVDYCNQLSDYWRFSRAYAVRDGQIHVDWRSTGWRLPTEAEWEYAARGEKSWEVPWGFISFEDAASRKDDDAEAFKKRLRASLHGRVCWNGDPPKGPGNVPLRQGNRRGPDRVGSFPQGESPFGLMDMLGGVWEWVWDRHRDSYETAGTDAELVDPVGPDDGELPILDKPPPPGDYRVTRGSSWADSDEVRFRATSRAPARIDAKDDDIGFRVVRRLTN